MKSVLSIIGSLFLLINANAQTSFEWKNYFPGTQVDSIVLLSTNKYSARILTKKDSLQLNNKELTQLSISNTKINKAFSERNFPLNDFFRLLRNI